MIDHEQLSLLLTEEYEHIQRLLALVQSEQRMLISAELENFGSLNAEKAKSVLALGQATRRRNGFLAERGYEQTNGGMEACLLAHNDPAMKSVWYEILTFGHQAAEINRVNGLLIGRYLSQVNQGLQSLQLHQAGGVYGPDGQTVMSGSNSRIVAG